MMRSAVKFSISFLALMVPVAALAEPSVSATSPLADSPNGTLIKSSFLPQISLGIGVSTLGAGVTANLHDPGDLFGLRAQANLLHFGINLSQNAAKTKAQATLQNENLILDYYPMRGHFYLSAGIVFNQNNGSFTSTPEITGAFLGFLSSTHYSGDVGNVHGPIRFNPIAPYLGFGYAWNLSSRISIDANFGAMYQGKGRITLTPTGFIASNPQARAGLEANSYKATAFMNKLSFYPILDFSLVYRF